MDIGGKCITYRQLLDFTIYFFAQYQYFSKIHKTKKKFSTKTKTKVS
jgi:hypothetical protein